MADLLGAVLVCLGALFFTAGTVGLLRLPDQRSRLHALTKADNLGLGFILLGVAVMLGSWTAGGVMVLIWLLAVAGASVSAHLLATLEASGLDDVESPERARGPHGPPRTPESHGLSGSGGASGSGDRGGEADR
ncbi:MAG: monovalent cation/H(+) antiporter subunit G [Nesterenkonia sp.]|nr:monovalent cation/H(+) antiporter subunit G [Nesterenkonia sp.]